MKEILENVYNKIVKQTFHVNVEGYSKVEVDNFLNEIVAKVHFALQDISNYESDLSKKSKLLHEQKLKIDELTYEKNRLETQIQKLEQKLKEANNV